MSAPIKFEYSIPEGPEFSFVKAIGFVLSYQDEVLKETKKLQEEIKKENK